MKNKKVYYGSIIAGVTILIVVVAAIIMGVSLPKNETGVLKKAKFTTMSDKLVEGMNLDSAISESFCSSKTDSSVKDKVKVFTSYSAFYDYYSKYCDIYVTYPEGYEKTIAEHKFKDGYVAVVFSATELQDPLMKTIVKAAYKDYSGNVVMELFQAENNPSVGYNKNITKECEQVFTVVYIKRDAIDSIKSLTFAANKNATVLWEGNN